MTDPILARAMNHVAFASDSPGRARTPSGKGLRRPVASLLGGAFTVGFNKRPLVDQVRISASGRKRISFGSPQVDQSRFALRGDSIGSRIGVLSPRPPRDAGRPRMEHVRCCACAVRRHVAPGALLAETSRLLILVPKVRIIALYFSASRRFFS